MTTKPQERRVHRATVTSKGQLTLPKALRDRFGLESGSVVDFVEEGETVTMQPARRRRRSFTEAIGTLEPPAGMTADEYISDMRHDPGDRDILQSGPGVKKITYIEDLPR
ncbi:AbrB/MazE/SpoVT family DNA-binding domain-containing protein [Deinococcus aestuarii]|uniref:AbrB/MazE/SpoVT family DNA-binding domain-containing protein n=1 Tax=Deinococcus aestuarii TaxID=2774531 RepID=UPI001C0DEB48|nr:AbrB/MazE/SpoVT family DNA-binding domain-containing protein [Deinococcus aestuarii]